MQVKDLKPAGYNPRKISKEKLAALKKSLEEFGDLSGIVFNIRTQTVVGGHQRGKVIDQDSKIIKRPHTDKTGTVALGYVETPSGRMTYREVDWPEIKEKQANIAANKHGGEFDDDALKAMLDEMQLEAPLDIELLGFDEIPMLEDKHLMLKNFTSNYGGGNDDHDHNGTGFDADTERYPVTLILEQADYEKWQKIKEQYGVKSDRAAFMKLLGGVKHA